jgi:hypothetical protein
VEHEVARILEIMVEVVVHTTFLGAGGGDETEQALTDSGLVPGTGLDRGDDGELSHGDRVAWPVGSRINKIRGPNQNTRSTPLRTASQPNDFRFTLHVLVVDRF